MKLLIVVFNNDYNGFAGKLLMFSAQFPEASRQIGANVISQLVTLLCDEEFMHKVIIYNYEFDGND